MKNYWTQPSLSRDFALLSAAVFFVLFLVSMWVTFTTYERHAQRIGQELQTESHRIELTLAEEMERANYMLTALGRQIVVNNAHDMVQLAQILKSFDAKGQIYAIFNWVNVDQKVIVSSSRGILEKPVDISDRDFVKKAFVDPWKMHIGRPIEGRVSGRWVIPVAMGLTDYTGKFIGTIMISLDISELTERISTLVKRDGISFAIISKTLIPLTQVSDDKDFLATNFPAQTLVNIDYVKNPTGLVSHGSMWWGNSSYNYYAASTDYPYIILIGYDNTSNDDTVHNMLWWRLLQMAIIAAFFMLFLVIVRTRMIRPVMQVTDAISEVAKGNTNIELPKVGTIEINALSQQVVRVKDYIEENKRVDDELRNKMFMLKRVREEMAVNAKSKSDFFAYICQQLRAPLNNIVGYAQVMKDQIYGPIENKKYRQYALDIYGSGNHVISHLDYILELAHIESHYTVIRETMVDVVHSIDHVLELLAPRLKQAEIEVKLMLPEYGMMLYMDEFRLQQMVSNCILYLLDNGLSKSTVTLTLKKDIEKKNKHPISLEISYDAKYLTIPWDTEEQHTPLHLVRRLIELHQGMMQIQKGIITIQFPSTRERFIEE